MVLMDIVDLNASILLYYFLKCIYSVIIKFNQFHLTNITICMTSTKTFQNKMVLKVKKWSKINL